MLNKFNFSYSTYETYCKSQLWFYFMKIANEKETNLGMQVYGDAGNVVHSAIEDWVKDGKNTFDYHWKVLKIDDQSGFKGTQLSKDKFSIMYKKAIEYCADEIESADFIKTEKKFEFTFEGMNIKGFIDLINFKGGKIILYDWKTNSTHCYNDHLNQRLLYSWAIWKMNNIIPWCKWVYLKNMDIVEDKFTEEQLLEFEEKIKKFITEIQEKGEDINKYSMGEWKNPFNKYYYLCLNELERRNSKPNGEIKLVIKGNLVYIEGDADKTLLTGFDEATKFNLPNKFWMQKSVKKKGGCFNLEDIGTVHFYNSKFKCFPIGLMKKFIKICKEYEEFYKKDIKRIIVDKRDQTIMNQKINYGEKLNTDLKLREYQLEAIFSFLINEHGILEVATGGGKTLIASEIIRGNQAKTLWIIDRKELLIQTKKTLEKLLNVNVGTISGGVFDLQNITIATVQSLNSKLDKLKDYLKTINMVVVDEFHKSAAASYQTVFNYLPNTKYRLGLTATCTRDDGKSPILFSLIGEIVYRVDSEKLIELGYLVKPKITFFEMSSNVNCTDYKNDYEFNIVCNTERNNKILDICMKYNSKILILVKTVVHGRILNELIPGSNHIHGTAYNREKNMEEFRYKSCGVLIMTISIGAEGLDIPDLNMIINAAANKGDSKSIQVLGRVLRLFEGKKTAEYIDFVDAGLYTRKHSKLRMKALKDQGHKIETFK